MKGSGAPPFLALVGPTASGKSEAGVLLAERLGAEVVSVDSMLVYRGMDVGTAKPDAEQRARVPHHLIDVVEPSAPFSVAEYQRLAGEAIQRIRANGRRPLLVGGTGLYYRAVVDELELPETEPGTRRELETLALSLGPERLHGRLRELDPAAAAKIEPGNARRTVRALEVAAITGRPFSSFASAWERYPVARVRAAGVAIPRDVLTERIRRRVEVMAETGLVEEVRALVAHGLGGWLTSSQAVGYAEVARHLAGAWSLEEAIERTARRTRALARRQVAWFRRDPRVRWIGADEGGATGVVDDLAAYLGDGG